MKLLVPSTAASWSVLLSMAAARQTPPAATPAAKADRDARARGPEKALIANERKVNEAVAKGDKAAFLRSWRRTAVAADSGRVSCRRRCSPTCSISSR